VVRVRVPEGPGDLKLQGAMAVLRTAEVLRSLAHSEWEVPVEQAGTLAAAEVAAAGTAAAAAVLTATLVVQMRVAAVAALPTRTLS
jgi:hypothetical protein